LKRSDQVRTRRELIDYDYVDKLDPEARDFLAQFTDEYYGGAIKKGDPNALHYSEDQEECDRLRKDCYNRNNEMNRCQYNLSKTTGKLSQIYNFINDVSTDRSSMSHEEFLIRVQDEIDQLNLTEAEKAELLKEIGEFSK
jgi:hypothetical protein